MEIPTYICFLAPIAVTIIIVWLSRYLSYGEPDNTVETKLNDAERLNKESGIEAYRIRETVADGKTTVDAVRKRESEARESVELAESAVREAHKDNRRTEAIIDECFQILAEAEKKR